MEDNKYNGLDIVGELTQWPDGFTQTAKWNNFEFWNGEPETANKFDGATAAGWKKAWSNNTDGDLEEKPDKWKYYCTEHDLNLIRERLNQLTSSCNDIWNLRCERYYKRNLEFKCIF